LILYHKQKEQQKDFQRLKDMIITANSQDFEKNKKTYKQVKLGYSNCFYSCHLQKSIPLNLARQ